MPLSWVCARVLGARLHPVAMHVSYTMQTLSSIHSLKCSLPQLEGSCYFTEGLLRFPINDVPSHNRIILLEFQPRRIVAPVLLRVVHVAAFGAAHLHQNAVAFFRHIP